MSSVIFKIGQFFFVVDRGTPTPALRCFKNGHNATNIAYIRFQSTGDISDIVRHAVRPKAQSPVECGDLPVYRLNSL